MSFDSIFDGIKNIPIHAVYLLFGMVGFGIWWRKSQLPNRYFPMVNLIVPIILYPLLEMSISDEPYHVYRNPIVVLGIFGAGVSISTSVLSSFIVSQLKKRFPQLEFPDDNGSGKTETALLKKTDVQPTPPPDSP